MLARVQDLEAQLAQTSKTSSQPPSQDKPWLPKSERQKSGCSSGGQRGHPGKTLKMSEHPDEIRTLPVTGQCGCGEPWDTVAVHDLLARQVHDLPEVRLHVTEYQVEVKICPRCAHREQAAFPADVPGQVQYGPRVHALTTYLNVVHAVPLERTADVVDALCGARPSGGTIMLNLYLASSRLEGFEDQLKTALMEQNVLHADETGSKLGGKMQWLHSVSNAEFTLYGQHSNRGYAAIEKMGVLDRFEGVVVHDAWNTYFQLPGQHALCNAHLLRELRYLHEHLKQSWAGELRTELQGVYHQRKTGTLTQTQKEAFYERFDALLIQGLNANPASPPVPGRRWKPKQTKGRNLALRCQQHRGAVLLFLERDDVPFDNNQAERDIRMFCIKRKISGGFRSVAGGEAFCRIRSYVSTLRKQGMNVWQGLVSVFRGDILMPNFSR